MNDSLKTLLVVAFLLVILWNLGSALYYLLVDRGQSKRTVNALTRRIALSVALIVLVVIGGYHGFLIGILAHLILLLQTQVGPFPYLYPLIPFNWKEFKRLFLGNFTMDKK